MGLSTASAFVSGRMGRLPRSVGCGTEVVSVSGGTMLKAAGTTKPRHIDSDNFTNTYFFPDGSVSMRNRWEDGVEVESEEFDAPE